MIQLVVNVNLLRELNERSLIHAYAKHMVSDSSDLKDDIRIRNNLKNLLDWDVNGDNGLGIYCSKFEKLKEKDWVRLVNLIKENAYEIKNLSYCPNKAKRLKNLKLIKDAKEQKESRDRERCSNENYEVSGRGKKAKTCIYEGREYKSRQECMYKEGITQNQLYRYLEKTGQV